MVSNETVRTSYAGNNSTVTAYVVPFFFKENSAVIVVVRTSAGVETTLVNGVTMTLSGVGVEAGGSFTTDPAIVASSTVIVYRRSAATQLTDYIEGDAFPSASHESALDRAIMVEQESRDEVAHALRIPLSRGTIVPFTYKSDSMAGLDSAGAPILRSATELAAWMVLNVSDTPYQVWADAAARVAATPLFLGQIGIQRDTSEAYVGSALTAGSWVFLNRRERLLANRTYYVRTDGSDSNTGLADTAGGAFLTWQKAADVMFNDLDLNGLACETLVRAGTYTAGVSQLYPAIGGTPKITGDLTTPANVVLSVTSPAAAAIDIRRAVSLEIGGFKIQTTTSGHGLHISSDANLIVSGKMDFGVCAEAHMTVNGGRIEISADYTISGGATVHAQATNNGAVSLLSTTVTLTGTPAFSTAFLTAYRLGLVRNGVGTFSGSATGPRFYIENGHISGALATLPGSQRGTYYQFFAQAGAVGNVGAGETTLWQVSVPAGLLGNLGASLELHLLFTTAANGNTKTPRLKFGATTFFSTPTTGSGAVMPSHGRIMRRSGGTSQVAWATVSTIANEFATPAETLDNAITFTVTGQGTSDNDLVLQAGSLRFCEA